MQHRDNYCVLYLHRYKKKPVLQDGVSSLCTCFYILQILVSDNNYTINYRYLIEYIGFKKIYIFTPKMSNNFAL